MAQQNIKLPEVQKQSHKRQYRQESWRKPSGWKEYRKALPVSTNQLQIGKAFQEKLGNQIRKNQPHPADDTPRKTQNKINQHINESGQ